jgi:hypothetical protein
VSPFGSWRFFQTHHSSLAVKPIRKPSEVKLVYNIEGIFWQGAEFMRRVLAFIGGVLSGGAIGTAAALLFTPASGNTMRQGVRRWYTNAIQAGEEAAAQKRLELETKWVEMTGPHPASESQVQEG